MKSLTLNLKHNKVQHKVYYVKLCKEIKIWELEMKSVNLLNVNVKILSPLLSSPLF